jgi:hypothetical protein
LGAGDIASEIDRYDELLVSARRVLEVLKTALRGFGVQYVDLPVPPIPVGVGIGVVWEDGDLLTISVGCDEGSLVNLTTGVLADVTQDRLLVLDACNRRTRDNSLLPFYLHDAEAGWDILLQQRFPAELLLGDRDFFSECVQVIPMAAREARADFAEQGLGGHRYEASDLSRLLLRSLM